jgi:hypothetical protein
MYGRVYEKQIIAAILVSAMLCSPLLAAPVRALGLVTITRGATIDNQEAIVGSSVYIGDSLATTDQGELRLRLNRSQIDFSSSTEAVLCDVTSGVGALLKQGAAEFSSAGDRVELRTQTAVIRTKPESMAHAEIRVVSGNELLVRNFEGYLEADVDGDVRPIPAGNAYRVIADDDQTKGPQAGTIPVHQKRRRLAVILIGAAGMGLGGYFIAHKIWESASQPQ